MIKLFNAILVFALLASGTTMYSLEYQTRGMERDISRLEAGIAEEREDIKLLHAEWSSLTQPRRIQKLAETLGLKPVDTQQLITLQEARQAIPDRPPNVLAKDEKSPLSELLEQAQ